MEPPSEPNDESSENTSLERMKRMMPEFLASRIDEILLERIYKLYNTSRNEATRVTNALKDQAFVAYNVSRSHSQSLLTSLDHHTINSTWPKSIGQAPWNNHSEWFRLSAGNTSDWLSFPTSGNNLTATLAEAFNTSLYRSAYQACITSRDGLQYYVNKTAHWSQELDTSQDSIIAGLGFLAVVIICLVVFGWRKVTKRQNLQFDDSAKDCDRSFEGMRVLRNTRDRSSTNDFFGMHLRERGNSSGDFSRGSGRRGTSIDAPPPIRRERVGSMDIFYSRRNSAEISNRRLNTNMSTGSRNVRSPVSPQEYVRSQLTSEENEDEGFLYDEFGLVTMSFEVVYYGPGHTALKYSALSPPKDWAEASRQIIPHEIGTVLRRNIFLDVSKANIAVKEPTSEGHWEYELPINDSSVYVVPPAGGGVINLYERGTPKEKWKEYTFQSCNVAAQFQLDVLAYQVLGQTLRSIFEVLSIVHQGSMASDYTDYVLHASQVVEENDEAAKSDNQVENGGCIAWDDAMRALSSIPTIRIALERVWLNHRSPVRVSIDAKGKRKDVPAAAGDDSRYINDAYLNRRVLLGPVDFFRLFVPALPQTAIPQIESNAVRMEQLLSWRKRAARAAVLVRAYAISRRVVNQGWTLPLSDGDENEALTRRLAYDDNDDNNKRDSRVKNEYYEASVSRDVLCHVRPFDFFSKGGVGSFEKSLVLSPYQAYSLVGMQLFNLPEGQSDDAVFSATRDPVEMFPSLATLISGNPELDFFVTSHFNMMKRRLFVGCFVRSLPKGIDPQFDTVMKRFSEGSKEIRDRKLHMMVQLGQRSNISYGGRLALRFLALTLRFRRGISSSLSLEATKDRSPLPSLRLSDYTETHHFGGALQQNPDLPKNYVSMTAKVDNRFLPSSISSLLFQIVDERLNARAMDFTVVLEGDHDDELPERALCSMRIVHLSSETVGKTLSPKDVAEIRLAKPDSDIIEPSLKRWARHSLHNAMLMFSPSGDKKKKRSGLNGASSKSRSIDRLRIEDCDNPLDLAANDVVDILLDLDIPIQNGKRNTTAQWTSRSDVSTVSVLSYFDRHDIHRFLRSTEMDVRDTALRLIDTASWRGKTFPIDKRSCRIELQSGQIFEQGLDVRGNPVVYFRNLCLGPWRGDVDATVTAMIHRMDETLSAVHDKNPSAKITLVILMGRPVEASEYDDSSSESSDDDVDESGGNENPSQESADEVHPTEVTVGDVNPRVAANETFQLHTSKQVYQKFFSLFAAHYPGRLGVAVMVPGKGKNYYYSTTLRRKTILKKLVPPKALRMKFQFVDTFAELTQFVPRDELVSIVGGPVPIKASAFGC
ncbi:unnamed protein product [Cylindrotheca closterium]|uniref:Transmembrane protein n=1 Tax=Cylindrotheca closterium TaxID=2856 RepID=A0AAD2FZD1_9STRA|nr:unnamed protein product [Cylindrotheca closterium]